MLLALLAFLVALAAATDVASINPVCAILSIGAARCAVVARCAGGPTFGVVGVLAGCHDEASSKLMQMDDSFLYSNGCAKNIIV